MGIFKVIPLYVDQSNLTESARQEVGAGCKYLLIQGATGSGKTHVAGDLIFGALKKNKRCFFVVPRKELLKQTSKSFKKFDIPHSFIASGLPHNHFENIYICSSQTLQNRMEKSPIPDVVVIDEVHYGGDGLDKIIKFYKAAGSIILGLSATPIKLSGKGLGCWFDKMVCGPSIRWLIDNKRLSDYRLFMPDIPDLSGIRVVAGEYNNKQLSEKMESDRVLIGNSVKHYKTHAAGLLGLTFGVSIKHSQILAEAYRDAGVPAMHIDGNTPDEQRAQIIKAYARRELKQLVNCQLCSFGFDLSSASGMDVTIECLTDNQPTMSLANQMQKWGRVLRYKNFPAPIFDHAGNVGIKLPDGRIEPKHGFPCDERNWTLEDVKKRSREDGEKSIPCRQCSVCFFVHKPSSTCPNCGFKYPIISREIDEIPGELSEIQIRAEKKEKRMEVGRTGNDFDGIIKIAVERGYLAGWAMKRCQLKKIPADYGRIVKAMRGYKKEE